jgi:hypothetical protein
MRLRRESFQGKDKKQQEDCGGENGSDASLHPTTVSRRRFRASRCNRGGSIRLQKNSALGGCLRPSLLLLAVLLACACSPRADQVFGAPGVVTGSSGAQPGYAIKRVRDKEEPATVIGDDGSLCRLIAERFAQVDIGDWLACEWTIAPDTIASIAQIADPDDRGLSF